MVEGELVIVTMTVRLLFFLLWLPVICAAQPSIAFYYGIDPPLDELRAFDLAVIDPDHAAPIRFPREAGDPAPSTTQWLAYVSVGEVLASRNYFSRLPTTWLLGENPVWGSKIIDQAAPGWPEFFVEEIAAPLWAQGFRGFFLDTLDSYTLLAKTPEAQARQQAGLVRLIQKLKARFPDARIIANRGFELLPQIHQQLYGVAAESLYSGWLESEKRYREVPEQDRAWLLARFAEARKFGLITIAIDYVDPGKRDQARKVAADIKRDGIVPWVANGALNMLGVGTLEVIPRKILMIYDEREQDDLISSYLHRFAAMPVGWLGYVPVYHSTRQALPDYPLVGRFAGVVSWLGGDNSAAGSVYRDWLLRQIAWGSKVAMFDAFGIQTAPENLAPLGLKIKESLGRPRTLTVSQKSAGVGFELPPLPQAESFIPLTSDGEVWLQLQGDTGETFDAISITPWGGYALTPYAVQNLANRQSRWVVDPFKFLTAALRLQNLPMPDVTSENGRRFLMVHVDGDGFPSRAELPGYPFAGEVMLTQLLNRYAIPHSISVIEGEVAPTGLFASLSPALEGIARRIMSLPHVEVASHSYSHPFKWKKLQAGEDVEGYNLNIKDYDFDLEREVLGSLDYINRQLSPKQKRGSVFLWTGDCNPAVDALKLVREHGLLAMNGGETLITRSYPTLTVAAPMGVERQGEFQVFAPMQNENVYTNLWTGPFYGFERLIETFQMTESPRRLKPMNIYYHTYSASKRASLDALFKIYNWALDQQPRPIYGSDYIRRAHDFRRLIVARQGEQLLIKRAGSLRQLRMESLSSRPDLQRSRNVAGWVDQQGQRYIHLSSADANLQLTEQPIARPRLAEANAALTRWEVGANGGRFALQGSTPLRFVLADVGRCVLTQAGRPIKPTRTVGDFQHFNLNEHAATALDLSCRN